MNEKTYFSEAEAKSEIGKPVELISGLPHLPKGTKGIVIKAVRQTQDNWAIKIEWRLPKDAPLSIVYMGRWYTFPKNRYVTMMNKSEYNAIVVTPETGLAGIPTHGYSRYRDISITGTGVSVFALFMMWVEYSELLYIGLGVFSVGAIVAIVFTYKYFHSKQLPTVSQNNLDNEVGL